MGTVFQVIDFTPQDLRKLIKDVITEEILNLRIVLNNDKGPPCSSSNELLSLKEASKILRITTVTLAKCIKNGELSVCLVGKRKKIKQTELEKYLLNKNKRI